jgi:hypothetical protein
MPRKSVLPRISRYAIRRLHPPHRRATAISPLQGAVFDRKQPQRAFPAALSDEGIRHTGGQQEFSRCLGLFLTENSPSVHFQPLPFCL